MSSSSSHAGASVRYWAMVVRRQIPWGFFASRQKL